MKKNLSAQTVIEMLVILAVLGALLGMIFSFSKAGTIESQVLRQIDRLITDIRRVQDIAYLSQEYQGRVPCGYGISFEPESYTLIVVDSANNNCADVNTYNFSPASALPEYRVKFQAPFSIASASADTIAFFPPEPKTLFFYSSNRRIPFVPPPDDNTAVLNVLAWRMHKVKVNKFGLVTLE